MPDYETMYTDLLSAISDQDDDQWKINVLATFAAPSLDNEVKELLKQDEEKIRFLPDSIGGSLFDYKNEVSILTDTQTDIQIEEETNVNSTEFSSITTVSNAGY